MSALKIFELFLRELDLLIHRLVVKKVSKRLTIYQMISVVLTFESFSKANFNRSKQKILKVPK